MDSGNSDHRRRSFTPPHLSFNSRIMLPSSSPSTSTPASSSAAVPTASAELSLFQTAEPTPVSHPRSASITESENVNYASSITECAVCINNLEDEEMARLSPNCNHIFHAECIDKWLSSSSTCPICRAEAEPRLRPEPAVAPVGRPYSPAPETERGADYNNGHGRSPSAEKANVSSSRLSYF